MKFSHVCCKLRKASLLCPVETPALLMCENSVTLQAPLLHRLFGNCSPASLTMQLAFFWHAEYTPCWLLLGMIATAATSFLFLRRV